MEISKRRVSPFSAFPHPFSGWPYSIKTLSFYLFCFIESVHIVTLIKMLGALNTKYKINSEISMSSYMLFLTWMSYLSCMKLPMQKVYFLKLKYYLYPWWHKKIKWFKIFFSGKVWVRLNIISPRSCFPAAQTCTGQSICLGWVWPLSPPSLGRWAQSYLTTDYVNCPPCSLPKWNIMGGILSPLI